MMNLEAIITLVNALCEQTDNPLALQTLVEAIRAFSAEYQTHGMESPVYAKIYAINAVADAIAKKYNEPSLGNLRFYVERINTSKQDLPTFLRSIFVQLIGATVPLANLEQEVKFGALRYGVEAKLDNDVFDFSQRFINDGDILVLCARLSTVRVNKLLLSQNFISNDGAVIIAGYIRQNAQLHELDLSQNNIGATGTAAITAALTENHTVTTLKLGNRDGFWAPSTADSPRYINEVAATALGAMLEKNTALTKLNIGLSSIGNAGAAAIATGLSLNDTLETLYLRDILIGDSGAVALAAALEENKKLTKLTLNEFNITGAGFIAIVRALTINSTLKSLNIRKEYLTIENEQAKELGSAIAANHTLTTLNLCGTCVGDDVAVALAAALMQNKSLTTLDLSHCGIGDIGTQALAETLKHNKTLTTLKLARNNIGSDGLRALCEALQENLTLACISFDQYANKAAVLGIAVAAANVKRNGMLTAQRIFNAAAANMPFANRTDGGFPSLAKNGQNLPRLPAMNDKKPIEIIEKVNTYLPAIRKLRLV
jgi:Ran GTPase-activating protein (RanGAP) involved in mRNA processing and transport